MPRILKANKPLICGCCGTYFKTWKGYEDQDQDVGYGICRPCQGDAIEDNKAEYEKMYQTLMNGVKPETKQRMLDFVKDQDEWDGKVILVNIALEKGWLRWSIG